jgi:glyoxylase-like metal-dependent hydrolase (beta-lactamase superfamily II)
MKIINEKLFATCAAAVLGVTLALPVQAQFGAAPAELELIRLNDDMVVISNVAVPGLVTALITEDGVLLVDDKFEIDHDNIMAMLRTVTDQPIKYVVNTHYHGDHSGGNAKLQSLGAVAVASDQARARMVAANQSGQPEFTLSDSAALYIGGKTVEIHRVSPAHTDGDVVVLFPDYNVLAAGDIFANGPGTSAQLVDGAGGGSAKSWPNAVAEALELDFETVVPGHGLISTRADLEAYRERTIRFRSVLTELVSQGRTRDEIEAIVRSDFAWEDFHVQMALDGLINEFR